MSPTVTVSVSGTSWSQSVPVCSGSACGLGGANGTGWKKVSLSVPAFKGVKNASLVVSVGWPSGVKCNSKGLGEDDVLIDGLSLV